ncbi:hypothetical protein ECEC4203_5126, partial [Escherichia coli EC4203]
MVDALA